MCTMCLLFLLFTDEDTNGLIPKAIAMTASMTTVMDITTMIGGPIGEDGEIILCSG